jgi:hypothetical protein
MSPSPATKVSQRFVKTNTLIASFADKLSDEQLYWAPNGSHSIAFHLWHIARWTDHFQAALPGMTPELSTRLKPGLQVWQSDGLAHKWRFDAIDLGYAETGMEMEHKSVSTLPFPPKEALLDYLRRVFAATEHNVHAIDDEQFQAIERPQELTEGIWGEATVGDALLTHLTHDSRHLGMMESLLGLQTSSGSATI